jgi:twitching motility protein PilU
MAVLELTKLLDKMIQVRGSDIYIAAGSPPKMNVEGKLHDLASDPLSSDDARQMIRQVLTDEQWASFLKTRELNVAYSHSKAGRFRVNVYLQRGTVASVIRLIRVAIPTFDDLHLPSSLSELALSRRGLILVTGATGSGKSTTIAAMIDYRASHLDGHIISIEDPIEYLFQHKKSLVSQREVGTDTFSFQEGLKNAMRQAPTVIFIGELRDADTVEFALHSAETGHLVLSTLHSTNASQTIERVLNFFSKEYRERFLVELSYSLRAIISQRLVPGESGKRIPVFEILLNTALARELIEKGDIGSLKRLMEDGKQEGMQTFDVNLKELVEGGLISEEKALIYADSASDLRLKLRGFT